MFCNLMRRPDPFLKLFDMGFSHSCTTLRASQYGSESFMEVFDRNVKLIQRERAAAREDADLYDYLKDEVASCLSERILDIKRPFKLALELGCGRGHIARNIDSACLEHLYMSDISSGMVTSATIPEELTCTKLVIDEEKKLEFDKEYFDLVLSNLSLHWVNNIPGCLKEVHRVLKKDGVFLASMFGGDTLYELRSSFLMAELEREGGFSSHVSPFIEISDITALLNQAGFTLITVDTDEITIGYPSLFELMWDLQAMGESNASVNRKFLLHRDTLLAASAVYREMYGNDNSIPATFQIIYMIGWKPDPNQPVSQKERGSGQISLKDLPHLNRIIKELGAEGRLKHSGGSEGGKDDNGGK